jgi:threonine synthase
MDIQVASNFERYLFYLYGEDSARINRAMDSFQKTGKLEFSADEIRQVQQVFASASVDDAQTLEAIETFHRQTGYLLDPHTAVGVEAGRRVRTADCPLICLATAHPAKFGDAVREAIGRNPELPPALREIDRLEKRVQVLPADSERIKAFVAQHAL